ncbi:MAG: hypothetical protein COW52_01005, partial [Nitrospirae bacterium CG17_big_fil_post_rev_8_21_14_2_50_50_9]
EKKCLNCHSPHLGYTKNNLVNPLHTLCFRCHDASIMGNEFKHPPAEQDCITCHKPHSSGNVMLLQDETIPLCQNCHSVLGKHVHPMAGNYKDPVTGRMLTCASCHDPHSSDFEKLTRGERTRELCARCHKSGEHEL